MAEEAPQVVTWEQRRDTARDAHSNWTRELELVAYQIGYRDGYREGFAAGWQAYSEDLVRRLAETREKPPASRQEPAQMAAPLEEETPPARFAPAHPTNNDLVLQVIKNKPGLRGVEIVQEFQSDDFLPMPERSVRTSLFRLKKAGLIVSRNRRWYPAEEAPADPPQPQETEMDPP